MNKRGAVLIMGLLVVLVLSLLSSAFYYKTINENSLTKRYVESIRAFWVAEAGVAEAIGSLPANPTNGNLGNNQYQATTIYRATINNSYYYDIVSTGTVPVSGRTLSRQVHAVVKTGSVDTSKFQYGIDAANDLCFGGNCHGDPNKYLNPTVCPDGPCWKDYDTTINFANLFGYAQSDVSAIASHYTDTNFMSLTGGGAVSGVNWVDVAPGNTLDINGTATGTGLLIVAGNVRIEGTYRFHGIIYVLGTLTARGTMDAYGSTLVASSAGVDTINGTPMFSYNLNDIINALNVLASNFPSIVSWKEGP